MKRIRKREVLASLLFRKHKETTFKKSQEAWYHCEKFKEDILSCVSYAVVGLCVLLCQKSHVLCTCNISLYIRA